MRLSRMLPAGLLGLLLAVAPAAAASAAPGDYPPSSGGLSVSATVVLPGGFVTISGGGFAARVGVTIRVTVVARVGGFTGTQGFTGAGTPERLGAFAGAPATAATQGFAAQSVTTNAAGAMSARVQLMTPSTNVITATGLDPRGGTRVLSVTVLVGGTANGVGGKAATGPGSAVAGASQGQASGVGGSSLPNTGASVGLPITAGTILVLVGAGLVTVVRRRRRGSETAA